MRVALPAIAAPTAVMATTAYADEGEGSGRRASPAAKPWWEFALNAYPTVVRGGEHYTTAIAVADRGPLHLEARYNYESVGARSAFIGWTLSGGETVTWELTPLRGGAWGMTQAVVPGLEASMAWGRLDLYIEAEHVRNTHERSDSYAYAWSELGLRPVDWLRVGVAGQRTRADSNERDIQRGPFAQVTMGPGHDRRLLVQPGIECTGFRRLDRRHILSRKRDPLPLWRLVCSRLDGSQ